MLEHPPYVCLCKLVQKHLGSNLMWGIKSNLKFNHAQTGFTTYKGYSIFKSARGGGGDLN